MFPRPSPCREGALKTAFSFFRVPYYGRAEEKTHEEDACRPCRRTCRPARPCRRPAGLCRGDKYVFTDDKGASIRAELDHDRDWSMITKDAPVEIRAEVDKDWTEIELDVLSAKPL